MKGAGSSHPEEGGFDDGVVGRDQPLLRDGWSNHHHQYCSNTFQGLIPANLYWHGALEGPPLASNTLNPQWVTIDLPIVRGRKMQMMRVETDVWSNCRGLGVNTSLPPFRGALDNTEQVLVFGLLMEACYDGLTEIDPFNQIPYSQTPYRGQPRGIWVVIFLVGPSGVDPWLTTVEGRSGPLTGPFLIKMRGLWLLYKQLCQIYVIILH